ncbi:MAG: beta-propeller domain-containing protein [Woeseiaceae bacterium]
MRAKVLAQQGVQIMRKLLILSVVSLLAVGCSNGGSVDSGMSGDASFLTADVHGVSAGLNPEAGIPAPPVGSADFGAVADDAREEVVRAIEEADLYRVSGDLLYLLSAYRGLTIVNLSRLELLGRLPLLGVPLEMYLHSGRALVLLADLRGATQLLEVAVTDPTQPAISGTETMAGTYRTSRQIGDVLYTVTDQEVRSFRLEAAPFSPASTLALAEVASFAHATSSFIFIAGGNTDDGTTIRLVDISDPAGAMALRGALDLPGYLGDDQKLNFGGGVLRVVTHDWTDSGLSRLFTVDVTDPDAPAVLATLELARGEQLFATQFTEDRAYLVTFEQVDPLWVIDLSDPARPVIASELVVPGYSTQMVADGTQLVTIGVDSDLGWQTTVSLLDVSNPAAPALLDREELGDSSSSALWERKAFAVYPNQILVPRWDGLAVVKRAADSLAPRGVIEVAGGALRGFPHGAGIAAVGAEEVVMADASTLNLIGRVTIAENVVDVGRLADGTLLRLVQAGNLARLGAAEVELWAEALYPYGNAAAIVGWDATGRAAYVVKFDENAPVVSARLDLNSGDVTTGGGVSDGAAAPDFVGGGAAIIAPVFSGPQAVLTSSGKLVLRSLPGGNPYVFGDGEPTDGVIVIDIPAAALGKGVAVRDAAITGLVADGTVLAFTMATFAGQDNLDRPLLQSDYLRIDLDTGSTTQPVGVPGYVVAATGSHLFTIEDLWGEDWSVTSHVVAARVASDAVEALDRLALPAGAYDLRAAGTTLFFSTGGGEIVPLLDGLGRPEHGLPESHIGTARLGAVLALGTEISGTEAFCTLLLPEDGAALVSRDGLIVERWDVTGSVAELSWQENLPAYPLRAHADAANVGRYLLALGYAGDISLP